MQTISIEYHLPTLQQALNDGRSELGANPVPELLRALNAGDRAIGIVDALTCACRLAEQRAQQAEAEAAYWQAENKATRAAASRAIDDALAMIQPQVAWEAKYREAAQQRQAAEERLAVLTTKLIRIYMDLFPNYEYISPEQALEIIKREFAAARETT